MCIACVIKLDPVKAATQLQIDHLYCDKMHTRVGGEVCVSVQWLSFGIAVEVAVGSGLAPSMLLIVKHLPGAGAFTAV
jgi:hypothetical protein